MKDISKDTKMAMLIAVLMVFAGYYFLIRPQASELAQAQSDRAGVEQNVSTAQNLLVVADGSAAGGGSDAPSVIAHDALDDAIPPGDELTNLLRQFETLAGTTGMVHSSIAPSPLGPNPFGPGGSIQVAITGTGTHGAARAYLAELQSMPRLVLIEQIGLHVVADQSAQLQLSVRVFTQATPSAAAP
jgi:Tfp pilus assembly protein PilO